MGNGFVFDGRHEVKSLSMKVKVLKTQICLLVQVEIHSMLECLSCLLVIQHGLLPM